MYLASITEQLRCHLSSPSEAGESGLSGAGVHISTSDGETLLRRPAGDLKHLQLHLVDCRGKLWERESEVTNTRRVTLTVLQVLSSLNPQPLSFLRPSSFS